MSCDHNNRPVLRNSEFDSYVSLGWLLRLGSSQGFWCQKVCHCSLSIFFSLAICGDHNTEVSHVGLL